MTNKISEAIKTKEESLGRKLTAFETLSVSRSIPKEDDTKERMEIIFAETMEGIQALNDFHTKLEAAKMSSGVAERHKVAHWWEAEKQSLLTRFNAGQIERIKPAA